MSTKIVTYKLDDDIEVRFEIDPPEGFVPAGPGQVLGRVAQAIDPAIDAAKIVIEKIREIMPDSVEVRFGVKASGESDWFIAKAAGEGSFEIVLTWERKSGPPSTGTL